MNTKFGERVAKENKENDNRQRKMEGFKTTKQSTKQSKSSPLDNTHIPKQEPVEIKHKYTFSLKPSVRAKIEKIAKENNYKSSSDLLNTMFENMD